MAPPGKTLFIFGAVLGAVLAVFGLALWLLPGAPYLGRLPGDIHVQRGGFSFYFPFTTCILISAAISLLFALMRR